MEENQVSFTHILVSFITKLSAGQRHTLRSLIDLMAYCLASITAYIAFIDIIRREYHYYLVFTTLAFVIYCVSTKLAGLSKRITRYLGMADLLKLGLISFGSSVVSGLLCRMILDVFPMRFTVLAALGTSALIVSSRIIWQLSYVAKHRVSGNYSQKKRVVVLGAGDGGSIFMENHLRDSKGKEIIAFLDDDSRKEGTNINGIPVLGPLDQLQRLIPEKEIDEVVIAIPSLSSQKLEYILELTKGTNAEVYQMPAIEELVLGEPYFQDVKKIDIVDLLGRQEISLDDQKVREELEGKNILITGAGGSIGSELVRQVSAYNPRKVVLLGHGENSIYLIQQELHKIRCNTVQYIPIIADIQNYDRLLEVFKAERPDIVYHAAAHKHVPLMEGNAREAVINNIYGTYNVAKAVDEAGVDKMVMISTDKAVNPPNVMGATKRVAELLVTGMNAVSDSKYTAVRFGNVLGSRGSVIPVFQEQIANGGPVTVTDFRMTRYFMTIPEASRLVIYAGAHAKGGEVFVLDMGDPVRIYDLAEKMILLSGHTTEEIKIVETGIRPGEKLYEELITSDEMVEGKIHEKIFLGHVLERPLEETKHFMDHLKEVPDKDLKKELIKFAKDCHQTHKGKNKK